jgi:hypothetical protein
VLFGIESLSAICVESSSKVMNSPSLGELLIGFNEAY